MAAESQGQGPGQPPRRRRLRYRVQAPLDVTVLRSGIPDTLPGRSVNLGEGGVAAVVAGELMPGEAVGIEIHLPTAAEPLRTRAMVRYHDRLRSGMEFVGLTAKQQAAIRNWATEARAEPEMGVAPRTATPAAKAAKSGGWDGGGVRPPIHSRRGTWTVALVVLAILLAIFFWTWNRGWEELESDLETNEKTTGATDPQVHVPADEMEKLVTHRVDPDYPAAARPERLRAVIILDVVVGRDGSVIDVHALNGPEILAQAAISALRWWRFEPYRVDGQPVVAETTVAVEFKP
jgi:TonB family protein